MPQQLCVLICQNRSCLNKGSAQVLEAFQANVISGVTVEGSGCLGQCSSGPTVRILPDEIWYWQVKPSDVKAIVEQHLQAGQIVQSKLNRRIHLSMDVFSS